VAKTGQGILDRYRLGHSEEEKAEDMSIIGHLNRSPYKSDKERVADVTILMSAGFDTTANQVYLYI
jgi:cytochrome P450